MTKLQLHDDEVSEVVSDLTEWNWPGMRMIDPVATPSAPCVLERWEAEDRRDAEDLASVVELSLAWLGG